MEIKVYKSYKAVQWNGGNEEEIIKVLNMNPSKITTINSSNGTFIYSPIGNIWRTDWIVYSPAKNEWKVYKDEQLKKDFKTLDQIQDED